MNYAIPHHAVKTQNAPPKMAYQPAHACQGIQEAHYLDAVTNAKAMENVEPKNSVTTSAVSRHARNVELEPHAFEPVIIVPYANVQRYKVFHYIDD